MSQARLRKSHRSVRWSRWLLVAGVLLLLLLVGVVVAAPHAARWYVRQRLVPRLSEVLGRPVKIGKVMIDHRRTVLQQVTVGEGAAQLLKVAEIATDYDWRTLLAGHLQLDRVLLRDPVVHLVRRADGRDNFSDLLKRGKRKGGGGGRLKIGAIELEGGSLTFEDRQHRLEARAGRISGKVVPGAESKVSLIDVAVKLPWSLPDRLDFARVTLEGHLGRGAKKLPRVRIAGGRVQLLPRLLLSAIGGTIQATERGRRVRLDLAGSYGGAKAKLWSAEGAVEPFDRRGELRLRAASFRLGRIASILKHTPVILPSRTLVDGRIDMSFDDGTLSFGGELAIGKLNLFHPSLARAPVLGVSATARIAGELRRTRLTVHRLDITSGGVEVKVTGMVDRMGTGKPLVEARLRMSPVPCQKVLEAIPSSLVPNLQQFRLAGKLSADLSTHIDFRKLGRLKLGGKLPIRRCKVIAAPDEFSAERLAHPFEQTVESAPGRFRTFVVGPENPDFVTYDEISPHVINVFLTTEDGGFFRHRGFIPSQFRTALARNLKRGGFRLGASTISMQMVKNVLLTHEKTLSRKLQELFLVWYLEQHLSKKRLMEIYLNVIEFGPDIFGVGAAAKHYFGKTAGEITPLEAAFFGTILPSPRRRYVQYCRGELSPGWDRYVKRVLARMHSRKRLTDEEYNVTKDQSLVFARDKEAMSERDCRRKIKELRRAWRRAYYARLKDAVLRAAPHQLRMYIERKVRKLRKRRRKR